VVDITSTATDASSAAMMNSSHPGVTRISLGGVGRNVAEGISALCSEPCVFVSAVGGEQTAGKETGSQVNNKEDASDDLFGPWLISELARRGMVGLYDNVE